MYVQYGTLFSSFFKVIMKIAMKNTCDALLKLLFVVILNVNSTKFLNLIGYVIWTRIIHIFSIIGTVNFLAR